MLQSRKCKPYAKPTTEIAYDSLTTANRPQATRHIVGNYTVTTWADTR